MHRVGVRGRGRARGTGACVLVELCMCQAENDALRAELKEAQARHAAALTYT